MNPESRENDAVHKTPDSRNRNVTQIRIPDNFQKRAANTRYKEPEKCNTQTPQTKQGL